MFFAEWCPNAVLVAIALICAGHFKEGRREALACAALVGLDWLEYVLSWTPYSLYVACKHLGIPAQHADIWMLTDALVASIVVAIGLDRTWTGALWLCLTLQVVAHGFYVIGMVGFDPYSRFLDWSFWAQIACFVAVGGPHVIARIGRAVDRLRHVLHSPAAAPQRPAPGRR